METKLAAVAPLLIPLDKNYNAIEGYISSSTSPTRQYYIKLTNLPAKHANATTLAGAHLECGPTLTTLLHDQLDTVNQRLRSSRDPVAFLLEIQNLIFTAELTNTRRLRSAASSLHRTAAFYECIQRDIKSMGNNRKLQSASKDLSVVTFVSIDAALRRHRIVLHVPDAFPTEPPQVTLDVPMRQTFVPIWNQSHSHKYNVAGSRTTTTLSDVLHQTDSVLDSFQHAWNWLDELDSTAIVLEPRSLPAPRSVMHRRIALGNHATLSITIDPLDKGIFPEMQVMGAERVVEPLLSTLRMNRMLWNSDRGLLENIQKLLGINIPTKHGHAMHDMDAVEDMSEDCAICYNYYRPMVDAKDDVAMDGINGTMDDEKKAMHSDTHEKKGAVPSLYCDNPRCGKPFHSLCLREWLAADETTRESFGTLFGACPYCSSPISVSN